MSFLTDLSTHIRTLVDASPIAGQFSNPYVYIHLPETYPSICIDGVYRSEETKQVSYALMLNLWMENSGNSAAESVAFYDTADALQAVLDSSSAIVANAWVAKPEPEQGRLRAQYICTVYPAGF